MYNYKHPFNFSFADSMDFLDRKHQLLYNKGALELVTMLKVLEYNMVNVKVTVALGTPKQRVSPT